MAATKLATPAIEINAFWRISNHIDLGGWGGEKFSSRWTSLGKRVVYLAQSPAGAMLEVLVHLKDRRNELPRTFTLIEVEAPRALSVKELLSPIHADWKEHPEWTQPNGDAWHAALETPLARVPSAILPRTWNYLLNPVHPEARQVRIVDVIKERFDDRLFRLGGQ